MKTTQITLISLTVGRHAQASPRVWPRDSLGLFRIFAVNPLLTGVPGADWGRKKVQYIMIYWI